MEPDVSTLDLQRGDNPQLPILKHYATDLEAQRWQPQEVVDVHTRPVFSFRLTFCSLKLLGEVQRMWTESAKESHAGRH